MWTWHTWKWQNPDARMHRGSVDLASLCNQVYLHSWIWE
jgi:hypothetical protein